MQRLWKLTLSLLNFQQTRQGHQDICGAGTFFLIFFLVCWDERVTKLQNSFFFDCFTPLIILFLSLTLKTLYLYLLIATYYLPFSFLFCQQRRKGRGMWLPLSRRLSPYHINLKNESFSLLLRFFFPPKARHFGLMYIERGWERGLNVLFLQHYKKRKNAFSFPCFGFSLCCSFFLYSKMYIQNVQSFIELSIKSTLPFQKKRN